MGLEIEHDPCVTAVRAGHPRIRADVATYPTGPFRGRLAGLAGSPPCQSWSMAGNRLGEADRPRVHSLVDAYAGGLDRPWVDGWADPRSHHAAQPVRWVRDLQPPFVVLEQVPPVVDLWEHMARVMRRWGYSTWVGVLNSADFGVPQTRRRAVLIARLGGAATPPEPTHAQNPVEGLFGTRLPWVSMAQAGVGPGVDRPARTVCGTRGARWAFGAGDASYGTGWTLETEQRSETAAGRVPHRVTSDRPAPTVVANADRWELRNNTNDNACVRGLDEPAGTLFFGERLNNVSWSLRSAAHAKVNDRTVPRTLDEPATTVMFGNSDMSWVGGDETVRLTIEDAGVLQSFPPDYPWSGNKTSRFRQVGNAVPVLLAARVLDAARGRVSWAA